MAAYMCDDTYPNALEQNLGKRWTVMETSFKWHPSCRHIHPSVDGLLELMSIHKIHFDDIESVECGAYQAVIDVLGDGVETVHQSSRCGLCWRLRPSMDGRGITDFTEARLEETDRLEFMTKVEMVLDDEINAVFSKEWMAIVRVTTKGGRKYEKRVETLKGDVGNRLTKYEPIIVVPNSYTGMTLIRKRGDFFQYDGWVEVTAQDQLMSRLWEIEKEMKLCSFIR